MNILEPDYQPRLQQPAPAQAKPGARPRSGAFAEYFVSRPETIWSRSPSATLTAIPANTRPAIAASDDYIVSRPPTIWSPQPADTPPETAPTGGAKSGKQITMWDGGKFDVYDVLDVINPLQHIPVISTIYRENTGDQIGAVPRVLGSMLFGLGPIGAIIGAASAAINLVIESETGKDIGGHIYTALFGDKNEMAPTPAVATTPPTAPAQAPGKDAQPSPVAAATGGSPNAGGAPSVAPPPPARNTVSNKFRLSEWYKRNQAQLEIQARKLAKARAAQGNPTAGTAATARHRDHKPVELVPGVAAPTASKPGESKPSEPTEAKKPDLLTLFDARGTERPKKATAPAGAKTSAAQPPVSGPWVADQMQKALQKYEHLMKSRTTRAPTVDKQG